METLVTLQLVLVVLKTTDLSLPPAAAPLLVGLAVSLGHLVAVSPAHIQKGKEVSSTPVTGVSLRWGPQVVG